MTVPTEQTGTLDPRDDALGRALSAYRDSYVREAPEPSPALAAFLGTVGPAAPREVSTRPGPSGSSGPRLRVVVGSGALALAVGALGMVGELPAAAQTVFDKVVTVLTPLDRDASARTDRSPAVHQRGPAVRPGDGAPGAPEETDADAGDDESVAVLPQKPARTTARRPARPGSDGADGDGSPGSDGAASAPAGVRHESTGGEQDHGGSGGHHTSGDDDTDEVDHGDEHTDVPGTPESPDASEGTDDNEGTGGTGGTGGSDGSDGSGLSDGTGGDGTGTETTGEGSRGDTFDGSAESGGSGSDRSGGTEATGTDGGPGSSGGSED